MAARPKRRGHDTWPRACYSPRVFGLGMMEIGLIIALAVMLFPPKELPKVARSIARIYGQVRKTADDFRSAVLQDEDLRAPLDEIKGVYEEARGEVRDAERKARQQLAKAQMELRMATARRLQTERESKAVEEAKAKSLGKPSESEGPAIIAAFPGVESDPESRTDELSSRSGSRPELADESPVVAADPRTISRPLAVAANESTRTGRESQNG